MNINYNPVSFNKANPKFADKLEKKSLKVVERSGELAKFYKDSSKFLKRDISKDSYLSNTQKVIDSIDKKNVRLNKKEVGFFRNLETTINIYPKNEISTKYLDNLLETFFFKPVEK